MATTELFLDTNRQNERFSFKATVGTTSTLRAYVFENGSSISISATESVKLVYASSRESSASDLVTLIGTATAGDAFVDFTFTAAALPSSGKYWASIILMDTTAETNVVLSDGMLIILKNPISN